MNPLTENHSTDEWTRAIGRPNIAHDLALVEDALMGLAAITRLLSANHIEAQEEDKAESSELGAHMVEGLCAAAESLAIYAYRAMGEIKTRAGRTAP